MVQAHVSGGAAWRDALRLLGVRLDKTTEQTTQSAADDVERTVRAELQTYAHPPGTRTRAPAGGPPGSVSGRLAASMHTTRVTQVGRGIYRARTGPTAVYSRAQERGYPGRRLPARPFQKPVTQAMKAKIWHRYYRAWAGVIES